VVTDNYGATIQQQYVTSDYATNVIPAGDPQVSDQLYQQGLSYLRKAQAIFTDCHAAWDLAHMEAGTR
jgi:hypothetical protein